MLQDIRFKSRNGYRAFRRWAVPYFYSRWHAKEFRPVLCYLYTEWHCNIDCHYCFQFENHKPGMDLETAKESIDWLKTTGCRVIALMGGEPLLRKDFVLDVIRYGSDNGFFVYLPTNGYLMDEDFIDAMGEAGVAAVNLAVDTLAPKKGLPKALLAIEPQFRYLVENQKKHGYLMFFNMNICRTNIKDVRILTEIAHQNRIGTDYHLNEPPQECVNVDHYKHMDDGLHITPDKHEQVDELLDWIIARHKDGWPMVNSVEHLEAFKKRMRGEMDPWHCRAGHNGALVRPDGTLSPCFDMITYDHDWGRIWEPKFDEEKLQSLKEQCLPTCSSTCFYNIGHYYNNLTLGKWIRQHTRIG